MGLIGLTPYGTAGLCINVVCMYASTNPFSLSWLQVALETCARVERAKASDAQKIAADYEKKYAEIGTGNAIEGLTLQTCNEFLREYRNKYR